MGMENARRQDDIDFIALWDILLENWTWVVGISAGFAVAILADRFSEVDGLRQGGAVWEALDPELAARWANDFVKLANELIRAREVQHAETSLAFLNAEIAESSVVELQRVLYGLVESELKTLMFANAREDFAFETIDSAVVPEKRFRPRRTLIVILGTLLGGIVSLFVVLGRELVSQQRLARATGRLRSN